MSSFGFWRWPVQNHDLNPIQHLLKWIETSSASQALSPNISALTNTNTNPFSQLPESLPWREGVLDQIINE